MKLSEERCEQIQKGSLLLQPTEVQHLLIQIPSWALGENVIQRQFMFKKFHEAMDFVNGVAAIANEQDHHPDIVISYNKVLLSLTTHKIKGLSRNDFILAAKINLLYDQNRTEKAA